MDPSILIVDDDDSYREMFAAKFREEGWRVVSARDGEEAWETLQRETPDVLFTGIIMPRLDGLALTERVKGDARYARMRVFILSHRGRPQDRERASMIGADGFFAVGFMPFAEIILRIKSSLNAAPRFTLRLDPRRLDDDARQALREIGQSVGCEYCEAPYALTFEPDPLRPHGFFSVYLECPDCRGLRNDV